MIADSDNMQGALLQNMLWILCFVTFHENFCFQGDKMYGCGTSDCLGHVALISDLFIQLAETKPKLKQSIVAVFIAA